MFLWYKQAAVCYAYLEDFATSAVNFCEAAKGCAWFTRGWTLQELIAPVSVRFYDVDWQFQGTRDDNNRDLESITGIDWPVLIAAGSPGYVAPHEYSVADRMSWAASRQTTRTEDIAYCLLGLFEVNLPLIYGEGMGAFRRLQEAIMQRNNDLSILAWGMPHTSEETRHELRLDRAESGYFTNSDTTDAIDEDIDIWSDIADSQERHRLPDATVDPAVVEHRHAESQRAFRKLLATAPSDFIHSKHISKTFHHSYNSEFSMTNKGLRIEARIHKGIHEGSRGYFLHLAEQELINSHGDSEDKITIYLKLQKIWEDVYIPDALVDNANDLELTGHTGLMSFYISNRPQEDHALRHPSYGIHIPETQYIRLKKTIPETQWDEVNRIFYEPEETNSLVFAALFELQIHHEGSKSDFIVLFDRAVTCTKAHPLLFKVFDCKEYPRQSEWIFSNRGPGRDLLWCDLEFSMLEVGLLDGELDVEVGGTMVSLQVGLELRDMWTVRFKVSFPHTYEDEDEDASSELFGSDR